MEQPSARGVRFAVLGPVRAWRDEAELDLGAPRQQALLALLLARAGELVPLGEIVDALWGEKPPPSAVNVVHRNVGFLRRLLEPGLPNRSEGRWLLRSAGSYRLVVDEETVDLLRFRRLRDRAGHAPPEEAATLLVEALALWSGPAAAGTERYVRDTAAFIALDRERSAAVRDAADAALSAGASHAVLDLVRAAAAADPLDESLQARSIQTLAAAGRPAEALAAYRAIRQRLADELGIEPGAELRAAQQEALRPQPDLASPEEAVRPDRVSVQDVGPPAQLPADLPVFVGRRRELALAARSTGSAAGTVLIGGMAGVGKTTLAVHLAYELIGRFPDGQLYVDLRGFSSAASIMQPAEALRGFLEALGVRPERIPATVDAQAGLYRSLLAGRRMLVVLDNARDTQQVQPLLPGSPGCLVIVTSRNAMTGLVASEGALPVPLEFMSDAEARNFLSRRLGPARVAAEPEAVRQIVAACVGLPLALAILAARAAARADFPLAAIAAEVRTAPGTLHGFVDGEEAADARTIFSWSYCALSEPAARLFRRLALLTGREFSLAAATGAGGPQPHQVGPLLAELTRANLLTEPIPGRYGFHDLLRAYAAELAQRHDTAEQRREVLHRELDHYLRTAYAAQTELAPRRDPIVLPPPRPDVQASEVARPAAAFAWFGTEHTTLVLAVRRAAEQGFPVHAWQLCWTLQPVLDRRGDREEWIALQTTALAAAERAGDALGEAYTRRGLGLAYHRSGRYADARQEMARVREFFARTGDIRGQAGVLLLLGSMADERGEYDETLRISVQALELARSGQDERLEALALNNLGYAHAHLGAWDLAVRCCEQAIAVYERIADPHGGANSWDSLAYTLLLAGRLDEALASYQRSIDGFRSVGDRVQEAGVLTNLAAAYDSAGDATAARQHRQDALTLLEKLGHPAADRVRAELTTRTPEPDRPAVGTSLQPPVDGEAR